MHSCDDPCLSIRAKLGGITHDGCGDRPMRSTDAGPLEGQEEPNDVVFEFCHDLRQPLATILALVAACRTEPDLQPGVIRRLRQIQTEASQMSEMVERKVNTAMAP